MPPTSTQVTPQLPHGKAPISAVILTRNEEANIAGALENLSDLADELIVVDMQSEDKTVQIAKRYTSRVYSHRVIRGFNAARNLGHEHASHDWILVLDADERLPEKLKSKLRDVVERDLADYVVFQRLSFALGRALRHGDHREDWQERFYKKQYSTPWPESVHLGPRHGGRKLTLPDEADFTMLHYTCPTIDSLVSRLQRYTPQDAIELQEIGYVFSPFKLLAKPALYLIRSYLWKQGFRDGVPGLIFAVFYAYYFFLARARVWENTRRVETGAES